MVFQQQRAIFLVPQGHYLLFKILILKAKPPMCVKKKTNVNHPRESRRLNAVSRLNLCSEPHTATSNDCYRPDLSSYLVLAAFQRGTGGFRAFFIGYKANNISWFSPLIG